MKILLLTTMLWSVFAGGDRERGMQLYKDGQFAEAQAAFTAALKEDPESAELQWNLSLAAWRAGDLATAEVAAEKYAALSDNVKEELHRGMLGAIRLAQSAEFEAQADAALAAQQQAGQQQAGQSAGMPGQPGTPAQPDAEEAPPQPLPLLRTALDKAVTAKQHFVRGVRAKPTPELLRNTERTLRKIAELKKRIEELEQQQQEQEQQDGDKNPDEQKPDDKGDEKDQNKSDEQKGDQKENDDQQKKDDQKGDEKKPDEKSSDGDQSDPKKNDQKKDPKDQKSSESDPKEGEGQDPPESPEPKPNESENPEPKPSPEEGKNGESDPNQAEKPENPEPGSENQQAKEGQPETPPEPKPGEQRSDAPGEGGQGLELTPEQAQRLLARAKKLDEQLKQAKARRTTRRRAVERDW